MTFPARKSVAARQSGFTLIEVLVAFLILSIGLLGVVALIVQSKVSQHQAVQRTRAVALADEMIERIRINPAQIETYNIGLNPVGESTDTPEPTPNCATNTCSPEQMAVHDLWSWEQALQGQAATIDGAAADGLVTPRGCIVFEPAASRARTGQLTVIVEWRGLVETSDALEEGDDNCGGESAGDDKYRRQVAVNTFVIDETEL
ncbi:MAG: type IV pilus modification protein PilV [Haliea sp.]|nr:type IV pilus modification protein PilV [Haliea sp.]